ncbi:MAG TPA: hypothetical protein VH275_04215 [Solirubrobacterales bacterium]|nr:hypothetical protein [Solirubrobacterales bacterium]
MAVAAPARKTAPAPPPSRTAPLREKAAPARPGPRKKAAPARRPRTRPTPKGRAVAAPVPARKSPARKAPARAPRRARPSSRAAAVGGQLIPFAGRTAVAVGQLPDSGLVVRMTRGRVWIGVLGVLLAGIVALNVVTLSFAASSGKIDEGITALEQENSVLRGRDARISGVGPVRRAAAPLGLAMPSSEEIHFTDAGPDDVATAAQRLAAAGPG